MPLNRFIVASAVEPQAWGMDWVYLFEAFAYQLRPIHVQSNVGKWPEVTIEFSKPNR